jgi:hypothetical protein
MSSLEDRVPIPPKEVMNVNLSPCSSATILKKLGKPGALSKDCSDPTGAFKKRVKWGVNLGPFKVSGLDYAVESLHQIFAAVKQKQPEVFAAVKSAGALCVRHRRKSPTLYSNHSWGTAIDIYFGKNAIPQGVHLTLEGTWPCTRSSIGSAGTGVLNSRGTM